MTMNNGSMARRPTETDSMLVVIDRQVVNEIAAQPPSRGLAIAKVGRIRRSEQWGTRRDDGSPDLVVLLVGAGTGWSEVDGAGEAVIGPGTVLTIPPGVAHAYRFGAGGVSEAYVLHVAGHGIDDLLTELRSMKAVPRCTVDRQDLIKQWVMLAAAMLAGSPQPGSVAAVSCSIPMFCYILGHCRRPDHRTGSRVSVLDICSHMNGLPGTPVSLPQLAALAGLSPTHFTATFRRATGLPPMRYLHRLRMQRACELLETTGMPVSAVAAAVGCADYRYFDRMFRRLIGQTPGEYRRLNDGRVERRQR